MGNETVPFEEAYRVVRSNLMVSLADLDGPRVMVTSAKADEGKTVTCANLALSFAQSGQRVVLVDLDLRHPNAHQLVGAHNRFGVTDVLLGRRRVKDCLQYLALAPTNFAAAAGMYFMGTGPQVPNPSELLGSSRTHQMLDELGQQADLLLIDVPPVLPVADVLVIGRMVSGAILVVESRRTTVAEITKTTDLLTHNQVKIMGVVLNKVRPRDSGYGTTYGYGTPFNTTDVAQSPDGTTPSANGPSPDTAP